METAQSTQCLDLDLLEDYLNRLGKNIVEQMLALYRQQVETYLDAIQTAQQSDSKPDWQAHCHKMKGAAASIGMVQLHQHLKLIEKSEASKEEKVALLVELKTLNEQALLAFSHWLENK